MGFINLVLSPLEALFSPTIGILKTVVVILTLLLELLKLIPRLFESIAMLADPGKIIKDAVFGFKTGLYLIFNSILDMTMGSFADNFKHNLETNTNGERKDKEACVKPTFLEVIILILCPPLAIFIRKGMKGFLTILVTTILTCFYYFPGVLFASLHIL